MDEYRSSVRVCAEGASTVREASDGGGSSGASLGAPVVDPTSRVVPEIVGNAPHENVHRQKAGAERDQHDDDRDEDQHSATVLAVLAIAR